MEIEIKVPSFGESINEVTLSKWLKKDSDLVQIDESICELESEKATNELPAEKSGKLKIIATEGSVLKIGDVLGTIDMSVEVETATAKESMTAKENAEPKTKDEKPKSEEKKEAPVSDKKAEVVQETYAKNVPSPAA